MDRSQHVLITGGAGFIGSHLARELLKSGRRVSVIDNLSTGLHANVADLESVSNFRLYVDTVREVALMEKLMSECDTVFHLASAVGVKLIMEQPVDTIDTIYQGTEVVLRLARRYRNRVLITSTSEVYGKSENVPYREDDDRLEGATTKHRWAYACAKALDEFLALAHWKESRLPVTIVRLFNTVGPHQRSQYGMVVPRFVEQALRNDKLEVHGDGSQSRCFCHVYDVVQALIKLVDSEETCGQIFNVGSTEELSILQLAELIISRLQSSSKVELVPYDKAYGEGFEDMQRRVPSIDRINETVSWQPTRTINNIIDDVAAELR
ncbi:MAG: GDP-mannose 4,6-dehydratase [Planctomycetaceae bacterium]|nr:GDP-mannose 4,6-dehydratase [Planctomycetaceae bacterium]